MNLKFYTSLLHVFREVKKERLKKKKAIMTISLIFVRNNTNKLNSLNSSFNFSLKK